MSRCMIRNKIDRFLFLLDRDFDVHIQFKDGTVMDFTPNNVYYVDCVKRYYDTPGLASLIDDFVCFYGDFDFI